MERGLTTASLRLGLLSLVNALAGGSNSISSWLGRSPLDWLTELRLYPLAGGLALPGGRHITPAITGLRGFFGRHYDAFRIEERGTFQPMDDGYLHTITY